MTEVRNDEKAVEKHKNVREWLIQTMMTTEIC